MNASTLIPMRMRVTSTPPALMLRIVRTCVRWRAHSGQRMPTGVGVMQSGQIGRPHDEQETPVGRVGWREQAAEAAGAAAVSISSTRYKARPARARVATASYRLLIRTPRDRMAG